MDNCAEDGTWLEHLSNTKKSMATIEPVTGRVEDEVGRVMGQEKESGAL